MRRVGQCDLRYVNTLLPLYLPPGLGATAALVGLSLPPVEPTASATFHYSLTATCCGLWISMWGAIQRLQVDSHVVDDEQHVLELLDVALHLGLGVVIATASLAVLLQATTTFTVVTCVSAVAVLGTFHYLLGRLAIAIRRRAADLPSTRAARPAPA